MAGSDLRDGVMEWNASTLGKRRAANHDYYLRAQVLAGVELGGRSLLDVGCGDGRMAFWAAAHGAQRVVGLEPEVEGSSAGMRASFRATAEALGLEERVALVPARLQDFDDAGERFDVLLLHASINHLDEDACTSLHLNEAARDVYRSHFRRLAELATPGAILVAVDANRRNLFQLLGVRNPLAPAIEWEKHQAPDLWAKLLEDVGFCDPVVSWPTPNALRGPGRLLLGNRVGGYLLTSTFRLRMRRGPEPG